MNNKGFTLIELLGVVTILAMLGFIVVPITTNIVRESKENLYETQIRNIKQGASDFVSENFFTLNLSNGSKLGISLGRLKELGYIDSNIKNPVTRENFSDDLVVLIVKNDNVFEYVVCTADKYCGTDFDMY